MISQGGNIREKGKNGEWEYRCLLDKELGIPKKWIIHPEVQDEIEYWLVKEYQHEEIKDIVKRCYNVDVSKNTISMILNDRKREIKEKQKEEPTALEKPVLYFNIDEGFVPIRFKDKKVKKIRGRVVSAYTGKRKGKKKRRELNNKKVFVKLYEPGEIVDSYRYTERLQDWLNRNYEVKGDTRIFGATDGASSLKKIVSFINNNVPIASRFHASRNEFDKYYMEGIKEGVSNWKDPDCLGYSAEGDIFRVLKKRLGTGQRILSIYVYKKMLRWDGIHVV